MFSEEEVIRKAIDEITPLKEGRWYSTKADYVLDILLKDFQKRIKPFEGQKNKRTLTVKYKLYYSPLKIWENVPKIFIEEVKFINQISGKFIILDDLKKNKAKHLLKNILLEKEKLELIIRKEFENPIKKYFIKSE
jgi:hypothetical protein